jgi:hypothetical protein
MHINMSGKPFILLCILALGACAGGGETGTGLDGGGGGTTTPADITVGTITGFGSVFVNGIEFETADSTFSLDGMSGDENSLAVGMVVTVEGSVNADGLTGTAEHIEFKDELEGVVLANDINNGGTLNIMGQTVVVDTQTTFESSVTGIGSVDLIQPGNIVEVSGYSSGSGTIYATRVEVKQDALQQDGEMELKGVVADLTATTFTIGALTIDYSMAQLENLPDGQLSNGLYVEVKSSYAITGNTLIAGTIKMEDGGEKIIKGEEGADGELEGVVTGIESSQEFFLNGQPILISDATKFESGTAATIAVGVKLEAEGTFNANGKLVAVSIKFRAVGDIQMEGFVDSVDLNNRTLTVFGQAITINSLTSLEDERDMNPVRYFNLENISATDYVQVHTYHDANGNLIATKLVRNDAEGDTVLLKGSVDEVNGTQIVIAGVTVDISALTSLSVQVGDALEVTGTFSNGILTADIAEASNQRANSNAVGEG